VRPSDIPSAAPARITRQTWIFVAGAIAIQLAITVPLAAILNTWIDESYTLRTTALSVPYAIHQAIHFELQPPLYFTVLTLWRAIDHSIFFARLYSVICAALLVYCAAQLSARYAPNLNPAWAAVLIALNPATIWAAEEIRCYAMGGLMCAVLLWTFYDGFISERSSSRARVVHALVAIAALYTQYFVVFVLFGAFLSLLILRSWTALRNYLVAMVVVVLGCIPIAYILHNQISAGTSIYFSTESLHSLLFDVFSVAFYYALPVGNAVAITGVHAPRFVALAGVIAVIAIWYLARSRPGAAAIVAWTIAITSCSALVVALWATKEPFGFRYVFVSFIPVMLALLASLELVQQRIRYAMVAWTVVFLAGALATGYATYRPLAKPGDWRRVAAFVESAERPNQPILTFQTENAMPLADYYHGRNVIVAVPRPVDFAIPWNEAVVVQSDRDIDQDVASVPGDHPEIWVVNTLECRDYSVDYHCSIFEGYLAKHYTVVSDTGFYHSRVRLLRAKSVR